MSHSEPVNVDFQYLKLTFFLFVNFIIKTCSECCIWMDQKGPDLIATEYPRRRNVAAQVAEELKMVRYAIPPMEERSKKNSCHRVNYF